MTPTSLSFKQSKNPFRMKSIDSITPVMIKKSWSWFKNIYMQEAYKIVSMLQNSSERFVLLRWTEIYRFPKNFDKSTIFYYLYPLNLLEQFRSQLIARSKLFLSRTKFSISSSLLERSSCLYVRFYLYLPNRAWKRYMIICGHLKLMMTKFEN